MAAVTTALAVGAVAAGAYQAKRTGDRADKAASQAAAATSSQQALEWEMYQQARADAAPWRQAGEEALSEYQSLLEGGISQYELSEAGQASAEYMKELTAAQAASMGQFQSERTPLSMALAERQVAESEYNQRLATYGALQQQGYNAAAMQASQSQFYSTQAAQTSANLTNMHLANAAAQRQAGAQMMGSLGSMAGAYMGYQMAPAGQQMAGMMMGSQIGQQTGIGAYSFL